MSELSLLLIWAELEGRAQTLHELLRYPIGDCRALMLAQELRRGDRLMVTTRRS